MPVIVSHQDSNEQLILLSCSIGKYPNLAMKNETGRAAVCDSAGQVRWVAADLLRVVEVDGHPPEHWLTRGGYR
jgi:hypothetical protein